jgi:glutamate dehydrogenase (NAD(P)+)
LKGKRIIVQGFGNVGYHFAKFCHNEGALIVGIIERNGGIYSTNGFDPDQVKLFMSDPKHQLGDYDEAEISETVDPMKIM